MTEIPELRKSELIKMYIRNFENEAGSDFFRRRRKDVTVANPKIFLRTRFRQKQVGLNPQAAVLAADAIVRGK